VTNLAPLMALPRLASLSVSGSPRDLQMLSALSNLRVLCVETENTQNPRVLNALPRLEKLDFLTAGGTAPFLLASLDGLTELRFNLPSGSAVDIGPLSRLTKLTRLELIGEGAPSDLSPLYALTGLVFLRLTGFDLTPEQRAALSEALPGCAIETEGGGT